jgi:hypothetical protein
MPQVKSPPKETFVRVVIRKAPITIVLIVVSTMSQSIRVDLGQYPKGEDGRDSELVSQAQLKTPYYVMRQNPGDEVQANSNSSYGSHKRPNVEAVVAFLNRQFLVVMQGAAV